MSQSLPTTRHTDGTLLDVFVQPRAARNAVGGEYRGALKVRTTAPPADGRANAAVEALIAELVDVPKSRVSVVGGHSSRSKRLLIAGVEQSKVNLAVGPVLTSPAHEPG
ncbi:MAG: DUF167 domain-containing protein [Actinomycetota bacterium]